MVDDLDAVAVRVAKVAGPRPVAVSPGLLVDRHAATFEKGRPSIHLVRLADDQTQMIQALPPKGFSREGSICSQ